LTPIILGLSGWADARMWVTSWEVSSAPMESSNRGQSQASQRWTMPSLGLRRGGDAARGRPVSETLGAEASGESEVFRDPSV
jgi:hypothetical protein